MKQSSFFSTISSLLIIKLGGIGDVLLATPVIENLKKAFPHIRIDILTERAAVDVVKGNEWVNDIIPFKKKKDSPLSLIKIVRQKKYDVVIDLYANPRTALVTKLSGAQTRIGFPFRGREYAYNIQVPPRSGKVHNVDFNLDVLRTLNIPIVSSNPYFPLSDSEIQFANEWIQKGNLTGKKIIGINPSGGWSTKKWKLESFAGLADEISALKQWTVLFFGGPGELDDIMQIQGAMKSSSFAIPKTSLKQMGALIQRTSYFISNDAGPMHIAASLGIPTLGIYGPTNPRLQGPYGSKNFWVRNESLDCLECDLTKCPIGNICMTGLEVETVFQAFQNLVTMNQ